MKKYKRKKIRSTVFILIGLFIIFSTIVSFSSYQRNKRAIKGHSKLDTSKVYCIQKNDQWMIPKFGVDKGFDNDCQHYVYAESKKELKEYICKNLSSGNCGVLNVRNWL